MSNNRRVQERRITSVRRVVKTLFTTPVDPWEIFTYIVILYLVITIL